MAPLRNSHHNSHNNEFHSTEPIHIVTWYMSDDDVSFAPLVELLTHHVSYQRSVERLELVTPSARVSPTLVQQLAQWIATSQSLRELVLFTVHHATTFHDPHELDYLRSLEQAAQSNNTTRQRCECSVKMIAVGDPDILCESLTTTSSTSTSGKNPKLRHLALDGALLQGIRQQDLKKLAFDLSWDTSTHILLLKDIIDTSIMTALLTKLAQQKASNLHTLKICYDPLHTTTTGSSTCTKKSHNNVVPTHLLKDLLASPTATRLTRLYFGNGHFDSHNTRHLVEAIQSYHPARGQGQQQHSLSVEWCACRFEAGTGRILQALTLGNSGRLVAQLEFVYPILVKSP